VPRYTDLPGTPAGIGVTADGAHALVSLPGYDGSAVAVLSNSTPWRLEHSVPIPEAFVPRGIAVHPSGRHAVIAGASGLLVIDVPMLIAGAADALRATIDAGATSLIQVALEPGGRFAFAADEDEASLAVFDFGETLAGDASADERPAAKLVGHVALAPGPVGVACAADGSRLFVTCQSGPGGRQPGVLAVLDLERTIAAPERTTPVLVPAGHSPVRVALAPDGGLVWVSVRGSNAVLAFDAGSRGLRAAVHVGAAPVGLAVAAGGDRVVVAHSNRYASQPRPETLGVIDAKAALSGRGGLIATVPAGVFPRELAVLPDGATVLAANFASRSLEAFSLLT
jgi:DNA-binding beta-propeller fold protein YncE